MCMLKSRLVVTISFCHQLHEDDMYDSVCWLFVFSVVVKQEGRGEREEEEREELQTRLSARDWELAEAQEQLKAAKKAAEKVCTAELVWMRFKPAHFRILILSSIYQLSHQDRYMYMYIHVHVYRQVHVYTVHENAPCVLYITQYLLHSPLLPLPQMQSQHKENLRSVQAQLSETSNLYVAQGDKLREVRRARMELDQENTNLKTALSRTKVPGSHSNHYRLALFLGSLPLR